MLFLTYNIGRTFPVKLFRLRMQNYGTFCDKFLQHYVIRGDVSPHFRRLIAVNDRFCGDKLLCIICGDKLHDGDNVTKRAKNGENVA